MSSTTGAIVFPEAQKTSAVLQDISGYGNYFNIVCEQVLWVGGNPVLCYEMTKLFIRPNLHLSSRSQVNGIKQTCSVEVWNTLK